MKIDGPSPLRQSSAAAKAKKTQSGGGDFLGMLTGASETAEETAHVAETQASAPLTSLLSLQEMPEEEIRRKKLVEEGFQTLDTLEHLRRSILAGRVPEETLLRIQQNLARKRLEINDPRLIAIIDDIELRAAVELAKLEMSRK